MIPPSLRKTFAYRQDAGGQWIVFDANCPGAYYLWVDEKIDASVASSNLSKGNYDLIKRTYDVALKEGWHTSHFNAWMADIEIAMSTKPMLGGIPTKECEVVAAYTMPELREVYDDTEDEYDMYHGGLRIGTVQPDSYALVNDLLCASTPEELSAALWAVSNSPFDYLTGDGCALLDELDEWLRNTTPCIPTVEAEAEMFGNRIIKDRGFVTDTIDPNVDVMDEVRKACQGIK